MRILYQVQQKLTGHRFRFSVSSDNYFGRLTTTILAGCP